MGSAVALIAQVDALTRVDDNAEVTWWGAAPPDAIASVEQALGVTITGSFRDFLLAVGGGGLRELAITGVCASQPLDQRVDAVYGATLRYREDWVPAPLPAHLIVVQRDPDDNEPFCLDTSRVVAGENPVVLYYHQSTGNCEAIASSFAAFYADYLTPIFETAGLPTPHP